MTMHKMVNGELVVMSPAEESAFLASLPSDPVPSEVSMAQARIALSRAGITEADVDAVIAALPAGAARTEAGIWWRTSNVVRRSSSNVATLGPALGLDAGDIDDLFRVAGGILA